MCNSFDLNFVTPNKQRSVAYVVLRLNFYPYKLQNVTHYK